MNEVIFFEVCWCVFMKGDEYLVVEGVSGTCVNMGDGGLINNGYVLVFIDR